MASLFCAVLLFSLSIISLESLPLTFSAVTSTAQLEMQYLNSFKSAVANSSSLSNWLPNQNPCNFTGVRCQAKQRVTNVNLSFIHLGTDFNTVAAYLLSLPYLETLSLISSNISGSFTTPSEFRCSSFLSNLDLSLNFLTGAVLNIDGLSSCSDLKSLNLSGNSVDFSQDHQIMGLGFGFKSLDLSCNQISGFNVVPFILYGGCNELTHLILRNNKIAGTLNFSSCSNLRYLDISSNNFSTTLPSFGDCPSLEYLDISANNFYGDIGEAIAQCSNLEVLNVSSNHFLGPIPQLPTQNLHFLSLGGNDFHGQIPVQVTSACPGLIILDLSSNNISGYFPKRFGSCILLRSLDVSFNSLAGELPIDTFSKMSQLRYLNLAYNRFSGDINDSFSTIFAGLELLDLSSNSLSGSIPTTLCEHRFNKLKELYLQNNLLTGSIPTSLNNCSQLVSLHLSFNFLTGTIPSSLGLLHNLRDVKLWFNQLDGEIPREIINLKRLETLILDFNKLTGPIPVGIKNCSNLNWISLSNNLLTGEIPASLGSLSNLAILKLSNNSFSGRIPPELGNCISLIWLDLNSNLLNGPIPKELFKQSGKIAVNFIAGKKYLYLKNNRSEGCHGAGNLLEFTGIRLEKVVRIAGRIPCNFTRAYGGHTQPTFNENGSIIFLDLSHNMLSDSIPKQIGTLTYLYVLFLSHNNLSGTIPQEIGNLEGLNILDLSSNKLDGMIPQSMTRLTLLTEIDMSNNNLVGMIPEMGQFDTFSAHSFMNNSALCGISLPSCGSGLMLGSNSLYHNSHLKGATIAASVAMGLLFALFFIFGIIIFVAETKKRTQKKHFYIDDMYSCSGTYHDTSWKIISTSEALSINVATFEKPLQKLTFADLQEATNGFQNNSLIGSGGFGDVYRAHLKDGSAVAIKKLIHISGEGDREFYSEMETIGKVRHRNLVSLLGYCRVGEERLLVYEYMKYGSLEDVLLGRKKVEFFLNWAARKKIAIGAARGLAFLHHRCFPRIIHRDMKSSNVLLDENLEARVSDFGMARLMNAMETHLSVSTLAGTPGYVPPEYYQSFRCSTKGDVYSYGVVLLELLTGRQPTDSTDFGDNNLVGWVKQHAKFKSSDVFDPVLIKSGPDIEIELLEHLKIACACLDDCPLRRPTMIQVMSMFKEICTGTVIDTRFAAASEDSCFPTLKI